MLAEAAGLALVSAGRSGTQREVRRMAAWARLAPAVGARRAQRRRRAGHRAVARPAARARARVGRPLRRRELAATGQGRLVSRGWQERRPSAAWAARRA